MGTLSTQQRYIMRAAVLESFKEPLKIWNNWKDPEIGANDAIVRIMANGIRRVVANFIGAPLLDDFSLQTPRHMVVCFTPNE